MNKLRLPLLTTLLLCVSGLFITTAQTYTIGADNGTNGALTYPTPFGDYYKTQRMQFLYLASELTAAGMTSGYITEIGWDVVNLPGSVDITEDYTLKILSSGVSSLGLTTWEPGASVVWGPTDYLPVVGINTFVFDTPYFWDGSSNIIVEICGGSSLGIYTKNGRVTWSGPLAFNGSHTRQSDVELNPCGYTGIEYYDNSPGGPDYRPQVIFTRIDGIDCAGTPDAGSAVSTASSVCVGELFSVSIDPTIAVGITYQWQKSSDGVSWSAIAGAIAPSYSTTQTTATYYRCKVTCTPSDLIDISDPVYVLQNDPTDCYCTPTYTNGTVEGDYASHVVLEDINNITGASLSPFYTYYTGISTDLFVDSSYTISITVGTYLTNNGVAAWIDYNADGDFNDASEKLGEVTGMAALATGNINFTVPTGAVIGSTRLRVREVWNIISIDPCLEYGYGETEDYNVNITPGFPPEADFIYAGDPTVNFTDISSHSPNSWAWDFDDGGTSTLQNPSHTFALNGTYNVCLTASNVIGTDTECKNVVISTYLPPAALFSYTGDPTVDFTDLSTETPTSWFWDFGDGFTSTEQNPTHTFADNGTYYVCLTATNAVGSNTSCQYVLIDTYTYAPVAAFTYFGDPTVYFVDFSTGEPTSWFWDFGDGITSVEENPSHTYATNGTYNVCLTATNIVGSNTVCQTIVINGYPSPEALFTYSGDPIVSFTDLSSNSPTSWFWDFDDGSFSTEQNPTHSFAFNDVYTVCLTVNSAGGEDTYCDNVEIESAQLAPVSDFYYNFEGGFLVSFYDISGNVPTGWNWEFGDGSISLLQNPTHSYAAGGNYTVCLTTTNIAGDDLACKTINLGNSINDNFIPIENIFPNPATDLITISFNETIKEITIELTNTIGQKIDLNILNPKINSNAVQLNVADLAAGNYFIKFNLNGTLYTGQFIKN